MEDEHLLVLWNAVADQVKKTNWIHNIKEDSNIEQLENLVKEEYDWDVKIEQSEKDKLHYQLCLKPPLFVPALDEDTHELWYVCTGKGINLRYKYLDNGNLYFQGDEEIINFINE